MASLDKQLTDLKKDICASLWIAPATFDELVKRDFLHNRSLEGVDRILFGLEQSEWIYAKGEKYFTYKSTVTDHLVEYDLIVD